MLSVLHSRAVDSWVACHCLFLAQDVTLSWSQTRLFEVFRQVFSILALIGFVGGQLTNFPCAHAHAGMSPAEQRNHDSAPHVHVGHHHAHGHDHSHAGHHHDTASIELGLTHIQRPTTEHDSDVVYTCVNIQCPHFSGVTSTVALLSAMAVAQIACVTPQDFRGDFASLHPPDTDASGAKLFLKLRCLRI
jgi:hypothetical protein